MGGSDRLGEREGFNRGRGGAAKPAPNCACALVGSDCDTIAALEPIGNPDNFASPASGGGGGAATGSTSPASTRF